MYFCVLLIVEKRVQFLKMQLIYKRKCFKLSCIAIFLLGIVLIYHIITRIGREIKDSTNDLDDWYIPDNFGLPCEIFNGSLDSRKTADLRIIILTYNRSSSLTRLLESLNAVRYGGDKVCIDIWVDRSKNGAVSMETVRAANKFIFFAGECKIHIQRQHVGIRGQWLNVSLVN